MIDTIAIRRDDGTALSTWTKVKVTSSLDQVARNAEFELSVIDDDTADALEALDLVAGEACEVRIGNELLITGWADQIEPDSTATADTLKVSVRSKTCDLVDSYAPPKALRKVTLRTLAEALCAPYSVEVVDEAGDDEVFDRVRPEPGEKVAEVIQRYARLRGVLVTDDAEGRLVLLRVESAELGPDPLVRGGDAANIIASSGVFSVARRYSTYECRGQILAESSVIPDARASVHDAGVRRSRRMQVRPDRPVGADGARRVAEWEALTRIGQGSRGEIMASGWKRSDGTVWKIGELVEITDARLRLFGVRWLITDATPSLSEGDARRTVLVVQPMEAYLPYPEKGAPGRGTSYWLRKDKDGTLQATDTGTVALPGPDDEEVIE